MKWLFSISNHKIICLIMLKVYRINPSQSDCTACKTITIEGERKVFARLPRLLSMSWNSIEIRWIGL
jgi:hypothetical protein